MKKNYIDYKKHIIPFFKVLFGGIILGLAYSKLMVPNQIINGGVTSLSMILSEITNISVSFYTQFLTILFLVLSFAFLGGKNFVRSIIISIAYTQSFAIFYKMPFSIQSYILIDFALASLLIGFGYYLCISAGASTVGIEVIALILKEKYQDINLAKTIRYLNYSVLVIGFIIYGIQSIIIGIAFSYAYSKVLDLLLLGKKNKLQIVEQV